MPPKQMSLEAALDEERLEILNILDGRPSRPQEPARSSHAPPIRSMLDIAPDHAAPRHNSIAGVGVGITASSSNRPAVQAPVRSLLDPVSPSPLRLTQSADASPPHHDVSPTSPISTRSAKSPRSPLSPKTSPTYEDAYRCFSETSSSSLPVRKKQDLDGYQFEMLPSIPSQALPKRVTQGGKKSSNHSSNAPHVSSMVAVMSGQDLGGLPGFTRGRDTIQHGGGMGVTGRHSKSPGGRSRSPGAGLLLNTNSFNPMPTPGKYVTDTGKVINLDHAYRRLSNAALSRAGGTLARFQKPSTSCERGEDEVSESGDPRLEKDYYSGDDGISDDDSSDDNDDSSSGDDDWTSEIQRGRRRSRKKSDSEGASDENGVGESGGQQKVRSLLAAAEEERKTVSATYKVKSLLDPIPSAAEKLPLKKSGVHPATSFDCTASIPNTPAASDDEAQIYDFKKAQNLSIYMSPIDQSVPNRVIRTIVRGEFTRVQEEVEQAEQRSNGRIRLRTYLVATDLSDESVYALEWTIGTILRDGDTLFAVYAIDEEGAAGGAEKGKGGGSGESDSLNGVGIADGVKAMLDVMMVVGSQTERTGENASITARGGGGGGGGGAGTDSKSGSTDSRAMSKAEMERLHAVEGISQTVVRLLRKTRLQVRVAVEVIHCKSPKHLITDAIDGLEPTLVILGSRGRSALKGVLLGSFSNYLVAKSSVPVMVARKKLRKHTKFKTTNMRLSNNLTTPKKLAYAKID
ncbi:hypothetical protein PABG_05296 [Paracoccidioides brasiliensis Pb03]|uniref:UspA domain-containing protein n=1 Tax=Paracoccidioides brasiliensis (strain Pb18) TaxID=502780 RepID=C1GI75_PARBD|nr:uncharacterized protein PADG_06961 [Paracoccidioides brasiliensis Pb18]EEH23085.2 hypothetical protein PABG_05296 [Paracoccidioides brasiliensis Pb03]EEH42141.2 hypothetical protein PADG_06961 [Paracoccidioides brasiliensis Pb18]